MPEAVVRDIEDFRANAPTPSLVEMQAALRRMDHGNPARKFAYWQKFCWETEDLPIGFMMSMMIERHSKPIQAMKFLLHKAGMNSPLPTALARAYEAPLPGPKLQNGAPRNAEPSAHAVDLALPGRAAQGMGVLRVLRQTLLLCAFADDDPRHSRRRNSVPGKSPGNQGGCPHTTIKGGGHFVQENAPELVAQAIIGPDSIHLSPALR